MYYVYVLQSKPRTDSVLGKSNAQSYVGSTNDLKDRFKQHNDGKVASTKRYKPWKLLYYEAYESEKLARMREKRLKYNGNAMKELKKRIGFPKINSFVKFLKSGAGFTLIELLVVVAIIGILAGGLTFLLNPADQIKKAQDTKRKSDLKQIQNALELYYNDYGKYPVADASYRITGASWGTSWTPYMGTVPKDPSSTRFYLYCSPSGDNGQSYYLYALLDGQGNSVSNIATACSNATKCGSGGGTLACNYGVSSPNVSP